MFWWIGIYATVVWAYQNFLESLLGIVWGSLKSAVKKSPAAFPERYGPWAVITGASEGIGREYAEQLAQKGLNIMLISLDEKRLMEVAGELNLRYGVATRWICVDFSKGPEVYETIRSELLPLEIGVLVNNVGTFLPLNVFDDSSEHDLRSLIRINTLAATTLTRMVLPAMRQRRRGLILNIGSSSGYFPTPYMAIYGASKAFIVHLTQGLQHELRGTGVNTLLVTPSIVRTAMSKPYPMPWFVWPLAPDRLVRFTLFAAGKTKHTCGHWTHCVQILPYSLMPTRLKVWLLGGLFRRGVIK